MIRFTLHTNHARNLRFLIFNMKIFTIVSLNIFSCVLEAIVFFLIGTVQEYCNFFKNFQFSNLHSQELETVLRIFLPLIGVRQLFV